MFNKKTLMCLVMSIIMMMSIDSLLSASGSRYRR